ncbi:UDP-glycosyltransferase 74C1 [Rhizoctonia solani 123E]|uniref:UDP-glycosyltransferase 74C1 n=1 Tax=Rhizoctonia solani 123E TaxID=1423351 RepID=A0A074SFQ7_9AGAM|nr:UDP-glycosyltransferase 74C1 [Rhizoctonia solani 123E]
MSDAPLKQVVFVPAPSWGHLRPAIKTSLRMVEKFQDLFISLFVYHSEANKAAKYLDSQTFAYSNRVRIVTASASESTVSPASPAETILYLEQHFKSWITRELQQATITQVEGRSIGNLSWIIEDLFNGGVSLACKDAHKLPIAAWWTTTAASLIRQVIFNTTITPSLTQVIVNKGTRKMAMGGGLSGTPLNFLKNIPLQELSNRLVCIPGMPAHHEWELATQYFPFMPPLVVRMMRRRENMIKHVNTIVCCTTFEMEPIAATALPSALNEPITPFFIGPAVDPVTPHQPDSDSPVTQFLDRAHADKGPHSVIYIAFGTAFFPLPSSMSHLITILDEISAHGYRFIFALPSARAKQLDQPWMDAHVQAGNAIFPEWTNQTAVLEHPAIHYFLSHGGWSSSTEALVRGIPMIFWPFVSDQPMNTMQLATVHNCGFELLQVRTGPAKSTAYQNGKEVKIVGTDIAVREEMKQILELSKGPRGEHQRMNASLLGEVITDSLGPGGSGDLGLEKFGKELGLVQ